MTCLSQWFAPIDGDEFDEFVIMGLLERHSRKRLSQLACNSEQLALQAAPAVILFLLFAIFSSGVATLVALASATYIYRMFFVAVRIGILCREAVAYSHRSLNSAPGLMSSTPTRLVGTAVHGEIGRGAHSKPRRIL